MTTTRLDRRWQGAGGWRHRANGHWLLTIGAVIAAVYLLVPPVLFTFYSAFRAPPDRLPFEEGASWSFSNFTSIYGGALQSTLADTSIFVAGSVALAMVVGFALAWLVERTDLPGRNIVFVLVFFPLMMPSLVTSMAWLLLLSERAGMINVAIRAALPFFEAGPFDVFSMFGMIVVQGLSLVGLVFLFASAGLRNMDPALEEASRTAGASPFATLRHVTLPVLLPHLLGVGLLASILTVESFEVPLLLAGGANADIFSSRLYYALNNASGAPPAYGTVAALGLQFLLITYLLFFLYHRLAGRAERYVTLMGRGYRPSRYALGRWRWPISSAVGLFLLIISIAPFLVLLWTSLLPQYLEPSAAAFEQASFRQYGALLGDTRLPAAWANTLVVALAAPTLSVGVAFVLAWVVARTKAMQGLRVALDLFLSSSIAIPGVVAASAFLLFYLLVNRHLPTWFPLYGTVVVLVLTYAYRLAVAYRISQAGIGQIARELEDASTSSGASLARTFRQVTLALARPSVFGAWVLLFLVAFREFTLPLVVGRESPPLVVSVLTWKLWGLHTGQAAALGVITVVFLSLTVLALRLLVFRYSGAGAKD